MCGGKWNYRVGTYMYSYAKDYGEDSALGQHEDERLFGIISAYYDKDSEIPHSYGKSNYSDGWESPEEIKDFIQKMSKAHEKPIIDLDNWPNEFIK